MRPRIHPFVSLSFLALILLVTTACDAGVNRSFRLDDGGSNASGFNTVNGSIKIGRDANVGGASRTVNGRISVDEGSKVKGLSTVNGSIDVDRNVSVDGDLETVNGSISSGQGTQINGDLATINGSLDLEGTAIDGNVETHNGSITLSQGSRVKRDVVIASNRGGGSKKPLAIKLLDGSIVEGDVIVRATKRKVTVYLENGSEVQGEVRGAEVVQQ